MIKKKHDTDFDIVDSLDIESSTRLEYRLKDRKREIFIMFYYHLILFLKYISCFLFIDHCEDFMY